MNTKANTTPVEAALHHVRTSGDTLQHAGSLHDAMFARRGLLIAGVTASSLALASGNPIHIFPLALAACTAGVVWDFGAKKLEKRSIAASEEAQQKIRDALWEEVGGGGDVFQRPPQPGELYNRLSLRWYGYDHDRPNDIDVRKEELHDLASFCVRHNIDEAAVQTGIFYGIPRYANIRERLLNEGRITSERAYVHGKVAWQTSIIVPPNANWILHKLTPDDLKEIANAIAPAEHEVDTEEVSYLQKINELIEQCHPSHPFITAYRAYLQYPDNPAMRQQLKSVVHASIRGQLAKESGVLTQRQPNGHFVNKFKVAEHVNLVDDRVTSFNATGRSLFDGSEISAPGGETTSMWAHVGHTSFEEVWQRLTSNELIPVQQKRLMAEMAAWHVLCHTPQSLEQQVNKSVPSDTSHNTQAIHIVKDTLLQRIARKEVKPTNKSKDRRLWLGIGGGGIAALMGVGGTVALSNVQAELKQQVPILRHAENRGQDDILTRTKITLGQTTLNILNTTRTIGDTLDGWLTKKPPLNKEDDFAQTDYDVFELSGRFGDSHSTNKEKVVWTVQAANPEAAHGYWVEEVQHNLTLDESTPGFATPPYTNVQLRADNTNKLWVYHTQTLRYLPDPSAINTQDLIAVQGRLHSNSNVQTFYTADNTPYSGYPVPVLQGGSIVAVEAHYQKDGKHIPIKTSLLTRFDGTNYLAAETTSLPDQKLIDVKYVIDPRKAPIYPVRAEQPLVFRDIARGDDRIYQVTDLQPDTQQIKTALGNPNLPADPASIARYIALHKNYSFTPYADEAVTGTRPRGKNETYDQVLTAMGVTAAQLSAEVCNTATLVSLAASPHDIDGTFVNPISGYLNNGDANLVVGEAHSAMVSNEAEIIDATPYRSKSESSTAALLLLAGLATSAIGAARLIRSPSTRRRVKAKKEAAWLRPKKPTQLAKRQQQVELLKALAFANPETTSYQPSAEPKELFANLRTLSTLPPKALRQEIARRRKQGWNIGPFQSQALQKINRALRTEKAAS